MDSVFPFRDQFSERFVWLSLSLLTRAYSGPRLGASVCGCALVVAEPGQSLSLVTEGRWAREYSAQDNKNNDTAAAG